MSSLMFRREPVMEAIGYWDNVRFGADGEFMRRVRKVFGDKAVVKVQTGPLSFQRQSSDSLTGSETFGWHGYFMGARKEYFESYNRFHAIADTLHYSFPQESRPFPVPEPLWPTRVAKPSEHRYFDVIIASDFRHDGGTSMSIVEEIKAQRWMGLRTGLIQMPRYRLNPERTVNTRIRELLDGDQVQMVVYGEKVSCALLTLRHPSILQEWNRFVPNVEADNVRVIVNQPPRRDYGMDSVVLYDIRRCREHLKKYFGKAGIWHPIGPLVREALQRHHAEDLSVITLASENWVNIIDVDEWRRPSRPPRGQRTRIGRHSRGQYVKWPVDSNELLSIYPDSDDYEVHVLGGADAPRAVLGYLPNNWHVLEFGEMHPKNFLATLDVFVYFTHPDWVESFGRVIIEAMAVGVPVILPHHYRDLFGEAAIYAGPFEVRARIDELMNDNDFYDSQVEKAVCYVENHFGYSKHAVRLEAESANLTHCAIAQRKKHETKNTSNLAATLKTLGKKEIKRYAEEAERENRWFDAIKCWHAFCEAFPETLEGQINILKGLVELESIYDAVDYFEQEVLPRTKATGDSSLMGAIKSFEILMEQHEIDRGVEAAKKVLDFIEQAHNTQPNAIISWRFFWQGVLNSIYHTVAKPGHRVLQSKFVDAVRKNAFSDALILSPIVLRNRRFIIFKHYLSYYKAAKCSVSLDIIASQIEKALVAYILGAIETPEKGLIVFEELYNQDGCIVPDIIAETAYYHARGGKDDEALHRFSHCLELLKIGQNERQMWLDSFKQIIGIDNTNRMNSSAMVQEPIYYNKIFFSGFGWSGSGAAYDYFKEFPAASYAIPWEFGLIEAEKHGLGQLFRILKADERIEKPALLYLFAKYLFGFSCAVSREEANYLKGTKRLYRKSKDKSVLAAAVNRFLSNLSELNRSDEVDKNASKCFTALLDGIIASFCVKPNQKVLLNNVIHAYRLNLIDLFQQAKIVVVKRDPRSEYVARYYENPQFQKDAGKFVNAYRIKRNHFNRDLKAVSNPEAVKVVQFEEFVLSEDYRNQLAVELGFELAEQDKFAFFKPWESEKNVYNYKTFPDQSVIGKIESELAEYLYEV